MQNDTRPDMLQKSCMAHLGEYRFGENFLGEYFKEYSSFWRLMVK